LGARGAAAAVLAWVSLAAASAPRAADLAAAQRDAAAARVHYMLECQGCHLADGAGSPPAVPPLRGVVGRFLQLPGGREYLIRVPGSAQSPLSDAELAAVLNWIIREFGPAEVASDFAAFSAEEVARHRKRPLLEVEAVRTELLRELERAPSAGGS
jgi:mono/diheme cytochrome c family protein